MNETDRAISNLDDYLSIQINQRLIIFKGIRNVCYRKYE